MPACWLNFTAMGSLLRFFPKPKPMAKAVVLAFPHAGGGPSAYATWPARFPGWLDLCAFAAPGRESRSDEPPCESWLALTQVALQASREIDLPLAIFGHSLGAWLGYDVTRQLAEAMRPPWHLLIAGARPPHVRPPPPQSHDEASLLAYVRALGGTSEDVLRDSELRRAFLRALSADLKAAAGCMPAKPAPLQVDATIFYGRSDPTLSLAEAERWRDLFSHDVKCIAFPGGHFFPRESRDMVISALIARLRPPISS
jgi:surfactin synthase thioesterase subunit